jgi:hypothetical protein
MDSSSVTGRWHESERGVPNSIKTKSLTWLHSLYLRMSFQQLFSSYMSDVKATKMKFVQKIRTFNVDEIDYWSFFDNKIVIADQGRRNL